MPVQFLLTAGAALLLNGCSAFPRDVEGTTDHVRTTHTLRVGLASVPAEEQAIAERFVVALAAETGSRPVFDRAASMEAKFAALNDGRLDLVIAEVASDSPWQQQIAVIEPLDERPIGKRRIGLSPIARAGENRWVMLLERIVRRQRGAR